MSYTHQSRFTETQAFGAWVYAILLVLMVPGLGGLVYAAFCALGLGLLFNLLCLRTRVTDQEAIVTFGILVPFYQRRIALTEIASVESVTYSPLPEYGGWGIRGWGKDTALNARGNRGVRLILRDGRRILIGSQRPDELAAALHTTDTR